MKKYFLYLGLLIWTGAAVAQGASVGASGYKNINNLKGLCSSESKEESYFQEGVCQSLKEQLAYDKCTAPLLEKLRQKLLRRQENRSTEADIRNPFAMPELYCNSRQNNSSGFTDPRVLKNPATFGTIVMQFFMAVAIAESNLDIFNNLQKGPGKLINASAKGGLMNLTLKQMDDPKYNKNGCGCHVTNSSEQVAWFWSLFIGEAAFAADNFLAGPSPGPRDAHHNIQCGAYMALVEAEKDGILFRGFKGGQDDEAPKGAAKIFASLQEIKPNGPPPNPQEERLATNPDLDFILKKVRTYCTRNLKENGTLNHDWNDDFDESGALREPRSASNSFQIMDLLRVRPTKIGAFVSSTN